MDTPTVKRPFSVLSPTSDSEIHLEKKNRYSPVSWSTEELQNSTSSNMASSDIGKSDDYEDENRDEDVPNWAMKILDKVQKTHNIVAGMESRFKHLETLVNEAKADALEAKRLASNLMDVASGSKDLAKECRDHASDLEKQVEGLEKDNKMLRQQVQQMGDYNRRENLILEGLEDNKNETDEMLLEKMQSVFRNNLQVGDVEMIKFDRFHRLGRYNSSRQRAVIIRFNWYRDRMRVWERRKNLKGSKLFLKEDFSHTTKEARGTLYPYLRAAISAGKRATQVGDKLLIDGTRYSVDDIAALDILFGKQDESEWRKQGRRRHWKNSQDGVQHSEANSEANKRVNGTNGTTEDVHFVSDRPQTSQILTEADDSSADILVTADVHQNPHNIPDSQQTPMETSTNA